MRIRCLVASPPLLLLLLSASAARFDSSLQLPAPGLVVRRDSRHAHHAGPLLELNETEITMYHQPTPPSYYTVDWEDEDLSVTPHPGLIISHAVLMSLAFFIALPIGIILRSMNHSAHGIAVAAFYLLCALGCSMGSLYIKLMPNMYEGSKHGKHGYLIILLALTLTVVNFFAGIMRLVLFVKDKETKTLRIFWRKVILGEEVPKGPEYMRLVVGEAEGIQIHRTGHQSSARCSTEEVVTDGTSEWENQARKQHHGWVSMTSDGTLKGSTRHSEDDIDAPRKPLTQFGALRTVGQISFLVLERSLLVAGLAMHLSGIVVYTGGCRQNYINGCLAHLIKGGIFWFYGILTFARFLGAYADRGWAWNKSPNKDCFTAEFAESFVICLYGSTNTWMERFGANPGDPFTTKQIQHISIAVMFCFAGLLGMAIESKVVRRWLASSIFSASGQAEALSEGNVITEPPSYLASFNPFPALVIGVTGAAMAAHDQTYVFQLKIHQLWGNLLLAFAVLRCLTYFFLWLSPPRSLLPSRPPTEALAGFFVACGGLVFIFSTEEVTIAAMRRGRDDVMMFLNVAVAITCFACCWTLFIVGFKGWLQARSHSALSFRNSAA